MHAFALSSARVSSIFYLSWILTFMQLHALFKLFAYLFLNIYVSVRVELMLTII